MNIYRRFRTTDGNRNHRSNARAHLQQVTKPLIASADPGFSLAACKEALLEAIAGPQPKSVSRRK